MVLKNDVSILIIGDDEEALNEIFDQLGNVHASLRVVSASLLPEQIYENQERLKSAVKAYEAKDLDDAELVIVITKEAKLSERIKQDAGRKNKLICFPYSRHLSNFYFGEKVREDNMQIAISVNGSGLGPRQFTDMLQGYVHTEVDKDDPEDSEKEFKILDPKFDPISNGATDKNAFTEFHWKRIASYSILAFFFMILGHVLLSYLPLKELQASAIDAVQSLDKTFLLMVVAGFTAQMIDGALGMGYGVTCTTFLLSLGINLPAISGSIHTAEMFSSAASGYSHYRFGNVNKKLFKALLIPGIIGAVAGAWLLSTLGNEYASYVRPVLATYTLILGVKIFSNAFKVNRSTRKVKRVGWLAGAGGFLDSFGGGGWGPLVTSTLIAKGKTPKYVIGTVSVTEFFVTFASALTFFSLIGLSHWEIILGLIVGGVIAAPLAARLAGKLPVKTMFITVGIMVVIWSLRIMLKSLAVL